MGVLVRQGSVVGKKVLVVDDDVVIRSGLRRHLEGRGYVVAHADSWAELLVRCGTFSPDVIIVDHMLGDAEAVTRLPELRQAAPNVPVVILTGHGSIDLAVRALKSGAEHFLTKPVELTALAEVLQAALANDAPPRRPITGRRSATRKRAPDPFVGTSVAIAQLRERAERLREGDRPVLILGETGTGKSVLARWLHANGPRASAPLVDLNCAALSKDLLESELFGHQRGAFTGAQAQKVGLVEAADGGTLFLDEIGDMDLAIQPKLLKVLEEGVYRRLGDVQDRTSDLRLVSATHQDLAEQVRAKTFRSDLFYRISAFPVVMPSLRERLADVPVLAEKILEEFADSSGRRPPQFSTGALDRLCAHDWPGNIRELRNVLERALWMGEDEIDAKHLDFHVSEQRLPAARPSDGPMTSTSSSTLRSLEIQTIENALREEGGRVEAAARRLGMPRSSLYHKIKALGLRPNKT